MINCLEDDLPDYPGIDLLKVYFYIWKYIPIKETSAIFPEFMKSVENTLRKSDERLAINKNDHEAVFYSLSIHTILTRLYVNMGINRKAIKEAQKSYHYLKFGMDYTEQFPEFNLHCGIYNFYRVSYPKDNPFVKPFLWFFMSGDEEKGLQMLEQGSETGLFTKVECLTYLFLINLRYNAMPDKSIEHIRQLHKLYPENEYFILYLMENLIYLGQFYEFEQFIATIENSQQEYYRYVGKVYKGLFYELHIGDYEIAKDLYFGALDLGVSGDIRNNHPDSFCYLGLGRIYLKEGKDYKAKSYLKKAIKVSEYRLIENEAKILLSKI
jgi:tetratricopeptide (TPR) repeat protein